MKRLGADCMLMAVAHVAHDCVVGDGVILANNVMLGGHVHVGDNAFIGGTAMATLVQRIQAVAGTAQGLGQACITPTVFSHAVGQHHHGLGGALGHP